MKPPPTPRVSLTLDDGTSVQAIAPLIVSASRATDIPAFFGQWFIDQLDKGYTRWTNPFNGKAQYVSFENTRCIVFWTKNPGPLLPYLALFKRRRLDVIFQLTLNNYEAEGFEPSLPPLDRRIETVLELSGLIGSERLLWRFDPLILTHTIGPAELLDKIERIGNRIAPAVSRLTVSFLSPYPAVLRRMHAHGIRPHDPSPAELNETATGLAEFGKLWDLEVVTCAERFSMNEQGVRAGSCIDPVYLQRIFNDRPELMEHIHRGVCAGLFDDGGDSLRRSLKDPGQRKFCRCMISKDIGRYGTCTHGCIYCYAGGRQILKTGVRRQNTAVRITATPPPTSSFCKQTASNSSLPTNSPVNSL